MKNYNCKYPYSIDVKKSQLIFSDLLDSLKLISPEGLKYEPKLKKVRDTEIEKNNLTDNKI